jgi:ABC-type transport system involved in cytochrome c biogenesis permease component
VSSLLAGVTAAVIWTSVCLMVGVDTEVVGLWALVFLVAGTAVSAVISAVVSRTKGVPRG